MSDPIKQLMKDMLDVKRRLSRIEANDSSETETWTAWTPTLEGSTVGGTFVYTERNGWYFRIEDTVFVTCVINISSVSVGATGNLRITGLPYANSANIAATLTAQTNIDLTAGYTAIVGQINGGASNIRVIQYGDNVRTDVNAASVVANDVVLLSGLYQANI